MSLPSSFQSENKAVFMKLAELVNTLSLDERSSVRNELGEYTHDLKHLLGLVTSASAVLRREPAFGEQDSQLAEMVELIDQTIRKIDAQIDVLAESLSHQIKT